MNYLVACDRFFEDAPGGSARVAWELARAVKARGHHVALICEAPSDAYPETDEVEGVEIVRYRTSLPSWHPRRLEARVAAAGDAVQRLLGGRRWDVVHSHTLATGLGAFGAAGDGTQRIATVHSPAVLEQQVNWSDSSAIGLVKRVMGPRIVRRAEGALYAQSARLSALSDFTIRELDRIYGPDVAARTTRIPWWCDGVRRLGRDEAKRKLGWSATRPAIFTLRRLVRRMGLDTLVEAAGMVANLPFELYVAGEGPELKRLRDLAHAQGVTGRVHFLGRVADGVAALCYDAADLFVLPTRVLECFGIIALEAMGRGCPVIAARMGAIPEVLGPESSDLLFTPGNADELATLLRRAVTCPSSLPAPAALVRRAHAVYGRAAIEREYLRFIGGQDLAGRSEPVC